MTEKPHYIRWFNEITINDIPLVGGKNASLGEMYRELTPKGIKITNGFAITAEAYNYVVKSGGILPEMEKILTGIDKNNLEDFARRGHRLRELIYQIPLPTDLADEITTAYYDLSGQYGDNTDVAVRSSATAEDLPAESFAGQQETYLNIKGNAQLLDACRRCLASLFTDRAISYRIDQGLDHFKVALSIGIMKMIRSDLASSGVMFSLDTESGFRDVVLISGAYGLGENVVQGAVNPDDFYVFKPTLRMGHRPVIRKKLGDKSIKMIYGSGNSKELTRNVNVPEAERQLFCLTDDEILELARYAVLIETHYSDRAGHDQPMDMEWAKDGISGELYIIQARPETVRSQKNHDIMEGYHLEGTGSVMATGISVGDKIASACNRKTNLLIHTTKQGGNTMIQTREHTRRILVVIRFTQDCSRALHHGVELAKNFGARLYALRIISDPVSMGAVNAPDLLTGFEYEKYENYLSIRGLYEAELDKVIQEVTTDGFPIKEFITDLEPLGEIVRIVEEEKIDLIITLAHEEGRLEHFLFGGENDALIRKLPCSVLLMKHEPEQIQ